MADNIEFLITAQNATKSAFNEIQASLEGLTSGIAGVATASAAIIAAAGVIALKFGDMADELDNNSKLLNISAQTLSDWQNVAVGANISGDALVGMLEKLSKNAGDAASGGNKQLLESFAAIGISQSDLQGRLRNLNELFPAVLDGVRSLGVGYDQVTRTTELFGRGAVGLVNVAREGTAAFEEQVKTHHRIAGVLSNEEVKAIADAKDKWDQLIDSLEKRGLVVFGHVITKLEEMAAKISLGLDIRHLNEQIEEIQKALHPEVPEQGFVDRLINGERGGSGELAGVLPAAKARLEAELKGLIETRDALLNQANGKPAAGADAGGGGGGGIGDPALAAKVAAAQAAAAELLALGQLDSVSRQVKTDFDLANAQRDADERVRILQGWAIADKAIKDNQAKLDKQRDQARVLSFAQSTLATIASATQGNKKMFEVSKAAALAGALIDAYKAITGAYKVGAEIGGPPLGAAFAAAAGVAQFATIAQIASTQFGGTATPVSVSGAGGFTSAGSQPGQLPAPSVATPATSQQQGRVELVIQVEARGQDLAGALHGYVSNDGVFIPAGSRQAMELA